MNKLDIHSMSTPEPLVQLLQKDKEKGLQVEQEYWAIMRLIHHDYEVNGRVTQNETLRLCFCPRNIYTGKIPGDRNSDEYATILNPLNGETFVADSINMLNGYAHSLPKVRAVRSQISRLEQAMTAEKNKA